MSHDSQGSLKATHGSQERRRATTDDYAFGKLIGEGSFSSVFLAKEVSKPNREVAVKVGKRQYFAMKIHRFEVTRLMRHLL